MDAATELKTDVRRHSSIELEAWLWSLESWLAEVADPVEQAIWRVQRDAVRAELAHRERMADPVAPLRTSARQYDLERIRNEVALTEAMPALAAVELRKRGNRHLGRCPFPDHRDSTPSMTVSADGRLWYCWGCGRGGDLFAFCQEWINARSFRSAVEYVLIGTGRKPDDYRLPGPVRRGSIRVA